MQYLFEEFKLYEDMWELTEAKADTEKLVAFAGENLANRFLAIKNRLKAPENDLYYWITNKTPDELEQLVTSVETSKSNTTIKKEIADKGAELINETAHWKIYHITTFEASQKYGRDTQWCITGVNGDGDKHWKTYKNDGVEFYFIITKDNYNARSNDSKFAIALYPDDYKTYEAFNQQDDRVAINEIAHHEEITTGPLADLKEAGARYVISIENSDKRLNGVGYDKSDALYAILDFIDTLTQEEKDNFRLSLEEYEDLVISVYSPRECDGPGADERIMSNWPEAADALKQALNMQDFSSITDDCSSYKIYFEAPEGINPEFLSFDASEQFVAKGISTDRALDNILRYISGLSRQAKRFFCLDWYFDYEDVGDFGSDPIVVIYPPSMREEDEEYILSNWDYASYRIKKVLGL